MKLGNICPALCEHAVSLGGFVGFFEKNGTAGYSIGIKICGKTGARDRNGLRRHRRPVTVQEGNSDAAIEMPLSLLRP